MAILRLLNLRRATHITQGFGQCCVASKLSVFQCRKFSNRKTVILDDAAIKPQQKPKTVPVPKITLLSPDNSMTITNLENAERLAKRRKLNLIKVSDPDKKTSRATYKLTSTLIEDTEAFQGDRSEKQKSNSPKLLYISATIAKHDLLTKIKNIEKLVNKGNQVKICITMDDTKENDVLNTTKEMIKDVGNIQIMPSKKKVALLLITPLDKDANNSTDNKKATAAASTISQNNNA